MKKFWYRLFMLALTLIMALSVLAGCSKTVEITATVADIAKHGNLILDITWADLFEKRYGYGDLLEVKVANQAWELLLCSNYSDVDAGVVTVVNLADASNTYELPEDAYYNTCQVTYLNLGMNFLSETSTASLASGMRFIINGEGPIWSIAVKEKTVQVLQAPSWNAWWAQRSTRS